jgi:hypothetical protein
VNDKYVAVPREDWEAILDSVRGKTGKTALLKSGEVKPEIDGIKTGGDLPEEAFVITGYCEYRFAYGGWDWFIEHYGNRVITRDISYFGRMFYSSLVKKIPFEINGKAGSPISADYMFCGCNNLTEIPEMHGIIASATPNMFQNCYSLRSLPEDIESYFDWTNLDNSTGQYTGRNQMFYCCYSLRSVPMGFLKHAAPNTGYSYSYFYQGFLQCESLDELVDLPIPYTATWTTNAFTNTFERCGRLKNLTFATPGGVPYVVNWKSQTINMRNVGYAMSNTNILTHNSGIAFDKQVDNDAEYQALKNDPDWYTTKIAYSRYNHDSAVATINSLPDTSAYLATAGGTNNIFFNGQAGLKTDGGAINTLTAEEIAVATAKGWTVTFS